MTNVIDELTKMLEERRAKRRALETLLLLLDGEIADIYRAAALNGGANCPGSPSFGA